MKPLAAILLLASTVAVAQTVPTPGPASIITSGTTYTPGNSVYGQGQNTYDTSGTPIDLSASDGILCIQSYFNGSNPVITDNSGNTYSYGTPCSGCTDPVTRIAYKLNATTTASWYFTSTASTQYSSTICKGFKKSSAWVGIDQQNGSTYGAGVTTISPGSITTAQPELVIVGAGANTIATATIDAGFSSPPITAQRGSPVTESGMFSWLIQSGAGAVTPTLTFNTTVNNSSAVIGSFK